VCVCVCVCVCLLSDSSKNDTSDYSGKTHTAEEVHVFTKHGRKAGR
jgi:hypothetical protein